MGWLIRQGSTKKETIARRTTPEVSADGTRRWSYPKSCVRGNCLWKIAVVEDLKNGEWVEVHRVIALDLLASDGDGWGYKDLDETMGPYHLSCPLSYLDMVPCPDPEKYPHAKDWRAAVREKAKDKQAVTAVIRDMKVGDRLYLKKGCQPEYVILSSKRPLRGHNGLNYKIPRRLVDPDRTRIHLTGAA